MDNEKNKTEKGVLYLVATPIGNLADITERALKVLSEVDFVAAEDTRNSAKLLSCYGISKPMVSYHQHNRAERGPVICDRLKAGESCALITDALIKNRFSPKRMTFVYSDEYHSPSSVLVEARKDGGEALYVTPPLILKRGGVDSEELTYIYENGNFPKKFITP